MSAVQQYKVRNITQDIFFDEALFDAELRTGLPMRIVYLALHTSSDRAGRFNWNARLMRQMVLDDASHVELAMAELHAIGKLMRYTNDGLKFGCIKNFKDTQIINARESQSRLPGPTDEGSVLLKVKAASKPSSANNIQIAQIKSQQIQPEANNHSDDSSLSNTQNATQVFDARIEDADNENSLHNNPDDSQSKSLVLASDSDIQFIDGFIFKKIPKCGIYRFTSKQDITPVTVADFGDMSPSIATFDVVGGDYKAVGFSEQKARSYDDIYPNADNVSRIKASAKWCKENEARRKTAAGLSRFTNTWVTNAQNKGDFIITGNQVARSNSFGRQDPDQRVDDIAIQMGSLFGRKPTPASQQNPQEREVNGSAYA